MAVVTEDTAFGLVPLRVLLDGRALSVGLHAAWRADHFAAATLALDDATRARIAALSPAPPPRPAVSRTVDGPIKGKTM